VQDDTGNGSADPLLSGLEKLPSVEASEEIDERRDKAGPARLMACTDPGPIVPMEILVEKDIVTPADEAIRDLPGHFEKLCIDNQRECQTRRKLAELKPASILRTVCQSNPLRGASSPSPYNS